MSRQATVSVDTLNLVKCFISCNSAFSDLQNPYLRAIVNPSIRLYRYFTLKVQLIRQSFHKEIVVIGNTPKISSSAAKLGRFSSFVEIGSYE